MVQNNKKNIKKPQVYSTSFDKLHKENQRRNMFEKKFKMPKHVKIKIKALLAASAIALAAFQTANVVRASEPEYTIGVAKDNAQITVEGNNYKIDDHSFVIVSENEDLAYDENGTRHEGHINNSDFKELKKLTEEQMKNYKMCQVTASSEVNVRSTAALDDDNILSTVPSQDYVLAYLPNIAETTGKWVSTLSLKDNELCEGYIYGDYLEIKDLDIPENAMKVNAEKLNLRYEPDEFTSRNILAQIPSGEFVSVIGETVISGDREWIEVEYITPYGQPLQGWVALEYLTPYISQEPVQDSIQKGSSINSSNSSSYNYNLQTNATGNFTGIDFSSISPENLQELLQNGIPNEVSTTYGNVNTSQFTGNINFAYIKLGASSYSKNGNFTVFDDYKAYEDQVKACEKLGVPYGFYYYSTAKTVEEANSELDYIKQSIENLKQKHDLKHFKLEIVVDVELAGENDRQYQGNIEEQTKAKAFLINGIQENNLSDNVLIYGPIRVMRPDTDRIIDLSYLRSLLSNPDDVALWLCSPTNTNGKFRESLENDTSYANQQGFSVVAHQVVLDGKVIGQIDINNMNSEHLIKLLNYEKQSSKQISTQNNNYDYDR